MSTAFLFTNTDRRDLMTASLAPLAEFAFGVLPELIEKAGFACQIISAVPFNVTGQGARQVKLHAQKMKSGDVVIPVDILWGLPGMQNAVINAIGQERFRSGELKWHSICWMLPQFPGAVQALAVANILARRRIKSTMTVIFDLKARGDQSIIVGELVELRETGTIKQTFDDNGPGEIEPTGEDMAMARKVLEMIAGETAIDIGCPSLEMGQTYDDHNLHDQLGISVVPFDSAEVYMRANRVSLAQSRQALQYCEQIGMQFEFPMPAKNGFEHTLQSSMDDRLRAMQIYTAMLQLICQEGATMIGSAGQFGMTESDMGIKQVPGDPTTIYGCGDDLVLSLLASRQRPFTNGDAYVAATERDVQARVTMRLLQLAVEVKYGIKSDPIGFHDFRHLVKRVIEAAVLAKLYGNTVLKNELTRWVVVLLNSGALDLRDLTGDNETSVGVWALMQDSPYFKNGVIAVAGEMVTFDKIKALASIKNPVGTMARVAPCGWNRNGYKISVGHFGLLPLTKELRYSDPELKLLNPQWPMGLAFTFCDAMRWVFGNPDDEEGGICANHTHTTPYDVLGIMVAIGRLEDWTTRIYGVR